MNNRPIVTYLLTLGILVGLSSVGYHFALQFQPQVLSLLYIGLLYMPTPLYALMITSALYKEPLKLGQYGTLKGLSLKNIGFTVALFLGWIGLFFGASILLSGSIPDLTGEFATDTFEVRQNLADSVGEDAARTANLPSNVIVLIVTAFIAAVISGFTINLLFALGEEYGWRGYLNQRLPLSYLKKHTLIGIIWGLWHAPLILQGYNYGVDYRLEGAALFILFTTSVGFVLGLLVERFRNILYAGAFHGMFNGFAGIFPFLLSDYNPLVGGPIGIISVACFFVIAICGRRVLKPRRVV